MADSLNLDGLRPAQVFDGGELDCGSGLVLLLREHMQRVAPGEHPRAAQPRADRGRRPAALVPDGRSRVSRPGGG